MYKLMYYSLTTLDYVLYSEYTIYEISDIEIESDINFTLGQIYKFKTAAYNINGYGLFSNVSFIGFGNLPNKPNVVQLINNSLNSIFVKFSAPISDLLVVGFKLLIDDGKNGDFYPIYDTFSNQFVTSFMATNLSQGLKYNFRLAAYNINGISDYLSISLGLNVVLGNPWTNLISFEKYIPEIGAKEATEYSTAIGLAMKNIITREDKKEILNKNK